MALNLTEAKAQVKRINDFLERNRRPINLGLIYKIIEIRPSAYIVASNHFIEDNGLEGAVHA